MCTAIDVNINSVLNSILGEEYDFRIGRLTSGIQVLLNIGYSRHILEDVHETENYEESEKARIVVNTFYTQLLWVHFSFSGHVKSQK